MTLHERFDFVNVILLFGVLVGATNALSVLSAEWFVSPISLSAYPHNSTITRPPGTHGIFRHDCWTTGCIFAAFGHRRFRHHCTIVRPILHPSNRSHSQDPRPNRSSRLVFLDLGW